MMAGVPDSLIAEFSTRSGAIEARTDELVADWTTTHDQRPPAAMLLQLRQQATLETRTPKQDQSLSLAEKMVGWRERSLATRSIVPDTTDLNSTDPTVAHHGGSVFDHQRTAGLWTTRQVIDDEAYLIARATIAAGPHLDPDTVTGQVSQLTTASCHALSADQARATAAVLSSATAVQAIIGPAGTGKTTTMAAVAQLWSDTHRESSVVGLAPSAVAAGVLGGELGVATENTTKWLYESVGDGAARRAQRVQQLTAQLHQLQARRPSNRTAASLERLAARLAEQHAAQGR